MPELEQDQRIPAANRRGHHPEHDADQPTVSPTTWSITKGGPKVHPLRFDGVAGRAARLIGVRDDHGLVLGDGRLRIRFGPWVLDTPITNLHGVAVTGPYHLWRVVGPPHLSLSDRGITFATTTAEGVRLTFRDPVAAIAPVGLIRHPVATVTVEDAERIHQILQRYLDEA